MARYTNPSCKICRQQGQKLFLKGERCFSEKCPFNKRPYPPGEHGPRLRRRKITDYGLQLREKQKMKSIYGVLEKQFRKYYYMSTRMGGDKSENLAIIVESRFDNVVFRMGFANSRKQARQLVSHGHFLLNGKKSNIPSILLKPGDIVEVKGKSRSSKAFEGLSSKAGENIPNWISVDYNNFKGTFVAKPKFEDLELPVDVTKIIELYSK
jgi:small subunit ribosomal protein S4